MNAITILLALAIPADGVPSSATQETRHVLDLTSLSHDDAASEEGRRGLYLIRRTCWPAFLEDGRVTFACAGPRGMAWTASLRPGQGDGVMVVEATLGLCKHPSAGGGRRPGVWEYVLDDAVIVERREK